MQLKQFIGITTWYARTGPMFTESRMDELWHDPNATADELLASYWAEGNDRRPKPLAFELREWKKVGRQIKEVLVKKIPLDS